MTISELKEHAVKVVNPRLNSYVYIITFVHDKPYSITRDKVYMKNKEGFITERFTYERFAEYGKCWCKTIKEAKAIIKKQEQYMTSNSDYAYEFKIKKCTDNAWYIETYVARSV